MTKLNIIENPHNKVSHRHACELDGHYYQCTEDCVCICGLAMNGHDHSDCPVELRPCPEHSMAEVMSCEQTEIEKQDSAPPHCECGCADIDASKIVGWCLHCDHVYAHYTPETENRHFANQCPCAHETVKAAARARLGKRRM